MLRPEEVRTWGSSHHPAELAWPRPAGKRGFSGGDTGCFAEGWARIAESRPQGA